MHTNYPLRLYHVPFHKLTVKKKLVNVKISREKFTDIKTFTIFATKTNKGSTQGKLIDAITLSIRHYVTQIDYKEFPFI